MEEEGMEELEIELKDHKPALIKGEEGVAWRGVG